MGEGLRAWREAPVESLGFFGYKLGLLLCDLEIPDSQSPDWVRLVAAPGLGLAFLSFGWLTPWAALGLTRGERSPFWWFLVATTVAGLISTAAFFVLGRYRVPWAPCVALLAAAGVVDLARRIKARRWGQVAAQLVLLAAPAAFFAWRPGADPDPDRWGYFELALVVANLQAATWTRRSMRSTTRGPPSLTRSPRRPSPGRTGFTISGRRPSAAPGRRPRMGQRGRCFDSPGWPGWCRRPTAWPDNCWTRPSERSPIARPCGANVAVGGLADRHEDGTGARTRR